MRPLLRALWLLIEAQDVAGGVAETGGDFGSVGANGLYDFAAVSDYGLYGFRDAVDHDVDEQAGSWRGRALEYPGSTDFVDRIVEGEVAVATLADVPSEDSVVEVGGAGDVGGGHFDVADFSVGAGWGHGGSGEFPPILTTPYLRLF
jgi:hypothetical protein